MSNYQKPKYKTINWPAYNKALKRRGSLTIWLDPTLNWYAPLSGKSGRSATYTDQAIECCLTIKALSTKTCAMHLLVDSTGVKLSETSDWLSKKHQTSKRQQLLKLHIAVDEDEPSLQSLIITDSSTGDPQTFPALLKQINPEQKVESVYCDGAYYTRACYQVIHQRGGYSGNPT